MPQATPVYLWEANVDLEVKNIVFSAGGEKRKVSDKNGNRDVMFFALDYLRDETVYWNPASRLKGWLKARIHVLRSGLDAEVQGGLKVYPADGGMDRLAIASVTDLIGSDPPPGLKQEINYVLSEGLPYPFHQFAVVQGGRSVEMIWYELRKPVDVSLKICSFARTITPEMIEDTLRRLGTKIGISDKHNQGPYGLFEVKKFEVTNKERLGLGG